MRIRIFMIALLGLIGSSEGALAQNWSFDARSIALGGVGGSGNLATKMIDEQRDYRSIVLPFGLLFQVFPEKNVFDPTNDEFDPVRAIEYAASPIHYMIGRSTGSDSQAKFSFDIRNATLSRDLSKYKGFAPASEMLAEGLLAPNWGGTIKVHKDPGGGFHGIFIGGGPYVSVHTAANIDPRLTNVLATGVNVANAQFPMTDGTEFQGALAVTGGYRGRFALPAGAGSGSEREGIYLAANYNYLHGFMYQNIDMTIRLDTDSAGLITLKPTTTPIVINTLDSSSGKGSALDLGVGIVIDRCDVGFGAKGIANRIDWTGVERTRYSLASLLSGDSEFVETTPVKVADARVELPVDYRGNFAYSADQWSAAAEVGHGFGGGSFHGGYEQRVGPVELRGGARYTVKKWNPTGGIGFDITPRLSLDVAAFGTNANIERKRRMAMAVSLRFNRTPTTP